MKQIIRRQAIPLNNDSISLGAISTAWFAALPDQYQGDWRSSYASENFALKNLFSALDQRESSLCKTSEQLVPE